MDGEILQRIVMVLGIVLVSMILHEMMHGYVAYWLGDDTAKEEGRLTFNPIAHIDPFLTILLPALLALSGGPIFGGAKPVPFNPSKVKYAEFGSLLVGIAGPITNLILAFISFGLAIFFDEGWLATLFATATVVNLGFFIFNMIPIPPLDGSRVLYYLAPESARRVMMSLETYGIIVVFVVVFFANDILFRFMEDSINFFLGVFARIFGV